MLNGQNWEHIIKNVIPRQREEADASIQARKQMKKQIFNIQTGNSWTGTRTYRVVVYSKVGEIQVRVDDYRLEEFRGETAHADALRYIHDRVPAPYNNIDELHKQGLFNL